MTLIHRNPVHTGTAAGPAFRVMQVVLSLNAGGTERLVIELCRHLGPSLVPAVCCLDAAGDWAADVRAMGIDVDALGRRPGFHPSLGWRIARHAARHRASVLHCHHYSPYVYGALATLARPGLQLIFTEHGRLSDAAPSRKRRFVNPWLARLGGRVFAVSGELRRHLVAEGFPGARVEVVYNGIAVGARVTEDDRLAVRHELGFGPDDFVIGSVARLDPVKNLAVLLQAQASLVSSHPHARVVLVGSGPEQAALDADARRLGTSGHVRFVGYRPDARRLMAAFDVYVNCSHYEGVSLTILEAMASDRPVIATRVGGNPEVVLDRDTGLLVPGRDAAALAHAIATMAADPSARRAMGARGRRRVEREFSIERMVADYRGAYESRARRASRQP